MPSKSQKQKYYIGREIGQLKAAVANRDNSILHYRELIEKHMKTMQRQQTKIKRLKRLLKSAVNHWEELPYSTSQNPLWYQEAKKELGEKNGKS